MDGLKELTLKPKTKPSISWEINSPLSKFNISVCKLASTKIAAIVFSQVTNVPQDMKKKVKQVKPTLY